MAAALTRTTGHTVLLDSPPGTRCVDAVTLRAAWSVEDIVEETVANPLAQRVLHPAALFAYRLDQLPVETPDEKRARQDAAGSRVAD